MKSINLHIHYKNDAKFIYKSWRCGSYSFDTGIRHRTDGPAIIDIDGEFVRKHWYEDGKKVAGTYKELVSY